MSKIAGLILAGGAGRRMGGADKAMLILGGRSLAEHCRDRLAPQVFAMAISANGDARRFASLDLPVIKDAEGDQGPLAGIVEGLRWADSIGASSLVTVAVDTPFFPLDLVRRFAAEGRSQGIVIAESGGRPHPTFALWHKPAWRNVLAAYRDGARALQHVASGIGLTRVAFDDMADDFFNINAPDDLAEAQRRVSQA